MACCCKPFVVVLQMGVLMVAGAVLGYVDLRRRPVMVNTPEIAPPPPAASNPATPPAKPDVEAPVWPKPDLNHELKKDVAPVSPPSNPQPAGEQIDAELAKQGHITVAQAWELFNAAPPAIFLDARRKEIYATGHVKLAYRLALDAFKGQEPLHLRVMDRSESYVIYCEGGNCDESVAVQKQLLLAGYQKVYVMHAGYPGWVTAGHPTEIGPDPIEEAEGRP